MDFSGNNRKILIVVIGLVAACVVCLGLVGIAWLAYNQLAPNIEEAVNPQPTEAVVSERNSVVERMVLSKNVTEDYQPVDISTVFSPQDVIHAVVDIKADAPADMTFRIEWYVGDIGDASNNGKLIDQFEIKSGGGQVLDFTLAPNEGWPAGTYRADLYVNGEFDRSVDYSVE